MRPVATVFLTLVTLVCRGQNYNPSVVILSPYETRYDSALLTEIESYYFEGYSTPEDDKRLQESLKAKPENISIMKFTEEKFRETKDFSTILTMSLYGMLSQRLFDVNDQALIFPSKIEAAGSQLN